MKARKKAKTITATMTTITMTTITMTITITTTMNNEYKNNRSVNKPTKQTKNAIQPANTYNTINNNMTKQ